MAQQNESDLQPAMSDFRQSRIYAEGWKAARGPTKSARNPYASEPERSRWFEGYIKGHD
jgi:hypothetical protein